MQNKPHYGGCQCGAVRFRTSNTPQRAMACHCNACKLRTGSAFGIGVYFKEDEVEFLPPGEDAIGNIPERRIYEFHSNTSNRWIRNEFCNNCGSAISWTLEMRPELRAIAGGAFDDPNWFQIESHLWTRSARPDMCYPDNVIQYEKAIT